MGDQEVIRITEDDIVEATRLSLSCPICAGAVERFADGAALEPVYCTHCQTLYHRNCWEQNGGKCAILGCGHRESRPYGPDLGPVLKIGYADIPKHPPRPVASPNGRQEDLKAQQRRRQGQAGRDFWQGLVRRLLRAIGWQ
jgi:hypothetical protein